MGIPQEESNKFLDDIFGKCVGGVKVGGVKIEGLVDASSLEDFDSKLNALEEHWRDCELPYAGEAGPQFFRRVQADIRSSTPHAQRSS